MTRSLLISFLFVVCGKTFAQDPHYTQFQASPLVVNPAYTGLFEGKWRVMANYRSQYGNLVDPFITTTFVIDTKLGTQQGSGQSPLNLGIQFMNDRTMQGIFSSNYLTATAAYHVKLDQEGNKTLGLGLLGTYGTRSIDFNQVVFDAQFASGGFNRGLPTGESVLQNMQPFFSVGSGLIFAAADAAGNNYFEIGAAGYNLNSPSQTVLADANQKIKPRFAGMFTYRRKLNDDVLVGLRGLIQQQSNIRYIIGNLSAARMLSEEGTDMIGAGVWYRTGEGLSPYVFLEFSKMQVGFSYDIATNRFQSGIQPARSFEMSFQLRISKEVDRNDCIRVSW